MEEIPSIHLKEIPEKIYQIILDKQCAEKKRRVQKINLSQAVIMLLKEAYLKEEK